MNDDSDKKKGTGDPTALSVGQRCVAVLDQGQIRGTILRGLRNAGRAQSMPTLHPSGRLRSANPNGHNLWGS